MYDLLRYNIAFLVTILFLYSYEVSAFSLNKTFITSKYQTVVTDSINQTVEGKKEGFWIIYGSMRNLPDYKPADIIEEGIYAQSRKKGVWKKYWPNGTLKSEITYINGRSTGEFQTFYKNGQLEEKGNWKGRVYTGSFERYYQDGTVSQKKIFNEKGKTEGVVEYFHTNGQLELSFTTDNGKEAGIATRYWPNGDIKETITFDEKGDGISSGTITRVNPEVELPTNSTESEAEGIFAEGEINMGAEQETHGRILEDGYHKTYNENKDILMDGEFLDGKLWEGKHYIYDENGLLEKIEVYKEGKYAGNGVF